jgi:hypothetical protein
MTKNKLKALAAIVCGASLAVVNAAELKESFSTPPDSARPGVYWYFMDGNMDREMMEVDLESMYEAGLRKALFLEVNIGVPRGPVDFMSEAWQDNFANAAKHADKLGIEIILGTGPGWAGSGGPWVKPEQSMQHLCASSVQINTPGPTQVKLPIPKPLKPSQFAGLKGTLTKQRNEWYADVAVLAFPTPTPTPAPDRLDVKALQKTGPYSIWKHVLRQVPSTAEYPEPAATAVIQPDTMIDLTGKMRPDGSLDWQVPPGNWTVMRFAARSTGQTTRPAPAPGHGFEVDKFDAKAFESHFQNFHQKLMDKVGERRPNRGWTALHLDSWEMSSQNWTKAFRAAFQKQCGYDPQPFYPAYHGLIVGSRKQTERFLYDMRRVAQELLLTQHTQTIKDTAHKNGFYYTSQGYDMNPAGDLDILSMADIPSCEFWHNNRIDSIYSCVEAVSTAHTMGKPIVRAEAFTSIGGVFGVSPGDMKNQSNWAFAMGINEFIFHTFQHQPLGKEGPRPGMTMGSHGIHWHRNQTFWPMVDAYHEYVARCGQILRQGVSVADVLYLTPEGAPSIFLAPKGALDANKDKHSYGFDAVSPRILMQRAQVKDGRISFDQGTSYSLMVLPKAETMTPELLEKITELVNAGATIHGVPPVASPSLIGFPDCDARVKILSDALWGVGSESLRRVGKGRVIRGDAAVSANLNLADRANWIWQNKGNPAASAEVGTVHFSKSFTINDPKALKSAMVQATADNDFKLSINGHSVMQGDDFNVTYSKDILAALRSGENVVSAVVENGGDAPNPAGFIAAIQLSRADGSTAQIVSDQSWNASPDGRSWSASKVLGRGGMEPWKLKGNKPTKSAQYPNYQDTAALLEQDGQQKIFSSDGNLRFHQRRTVDRDIFFVANREAGASSCTGVFRTDGANPELWDPTNGSVKALPSFSKQKNGTVRVPLQFAAHEGVFIVFDRTATAEKSEGANFASHKPLQTIDGTWQVRFDPTWGGPDQPVSFAALTDWTTHKDSGIKYYSGIAVYQTRFDSSPAELDSEMLLDLGKVEDMARVTLNGKLLGTVWSAPYRVAIPAGLLKKRDNLLKIEVVNTWHNRLVGDTKPKDKGARKLKWENGLLGGKSYSAGRYTFSNKPDARGKLHPAGLLGPVRIMTSGDK